MTQADRRMKNNTSYKVKIPTQFGLKTFLFKMTCHFSGAELETMTRIAEWTARNADSQDFLCGQLLVDLNAKLDKITPDHELWNLLDKNSQSSERNFLMWKGHLKHEDTITITHFGPMGYRQEFVFLNALTTSPWARNNKSKYQRRTR